ncbi:MAG: C39 family peptidase [Oscillospiraceae bacterium]|nr:C39 family peptidase [Oscillospiraceae bacterium]
MNRRRKYRNYYRLRALLAVSLLLNIILIVILLISRSNQGTGNSAPDGSFSDADKMITAFAKEHDLELSDWPDSLRELLEKNPETEEFVLQYPLKKDTETDIDLSEYVGSSEVPLFLQWDERWGYSKYGSNIMGLSGCGPTCLSMVCMYLLDDARYSPRYIADFAQQNGYCVPGNGSAWTLISEGGGLLGLDVTEIPLDENRIIRNLEEGNPIICIMGPGDFTTSGHFIVMTGYEDGKIKVNDPNSLIRSGILWDYDAIKDQIRNLWVCR